MADLYTVDAVAWEEFIGDWQQYVSGDPKMPFFRVREGLVAVIASAQKAPPAAAVPVRTLAEYHEDFGPVTWWRFPVDEPAWIGTPNDSDWPGYHTHWTPHLAVPAMLAAANKENTND